MERKPPRAEERASLGAGSRVVPRDQAGDPVPLRVAGQGIQQCRPDAPPPLRADHVEVQGPVRPAAPRGECPRRCPQDTEGRRRDGEQDVGRVPSPEDMGQEHSAGPQLRAGRRPNGHRGGSRLDVGGHGASPVADGRWADRRPGR